MLDGDDDWPAESVSAEVTAGAGCAFAEGLARPLLGSAVAGTSGDGRDAAGACSLRWPAA